MTRQDRYTFTATAKKNTTSNIDETVKYPLKNKKKHFKKEIMDLFHKYGYLQNDKDYEVTFKITSGNIAWININSIEIIK